MMTHVLLYTEFDNKGDLMKIEKLRILDNDRMETPEGSIIAPTTYFMDVELNQEDSLAIPINAETYFVLHGLMSEGEDTIGLSHLV